MSTKKLDLTKFSAEHLFEEYTHFNSEEQVKEMRQILLTKDAVGLFKFDEDYGCWIFHSMLKNGGMHSKNIAEKYHRPIEEAKPKSELDIEKAFAKYLESAGIKVRRQVRCATGCADIVTGTTVYEVEMYLSRQKIFEAIGQVMLYREAINPDLEAAIVGMASGTAHIQAKKYAARFGVQIIIWNPDKETAE